MISEDSFLSCSKYLRHYKTCKTIDYPDMNLNSVCNQIPISFSHLCCLWLPRKLVVLHQL